ncbi:hypothetical protein YPPY66_1992 [Yersinia pestis PY-66]|nr:hypothetical protein YPPY36_1963 [Yersinia pestis PY-36]EIS06524.1 hypothetical protein YPPY46_1782 [Yersinia pestis PY-46]EIS19941.1 hypothetical protein YPPY52_1845 [Yersinia pestis PY-52]EIS46908.1 hypothetical protein YPPY59_1854 [Yersinia pestis PY-59]EIS58024.1 hypothetical protein YPPY61_1849 [Yersinia pestis PY-61]EIS78872.1 hypothetical protein YPPY66_1992 [Yersinia pestis PY-66]EIS88768.1 hypothetical protein YPPY76_1702 [Yersinia pestis PY-76]EIT00402.1 hypothetical protein YPP
MITLIIGKSTAFIEKWELQQYWTSVGDVQGALTFVFKFHEFLLLNVIK